MPGKPVIYTTQLERAHGDRLSGVPLPQRLHPGDEAYANSTRPTVDSLPPLQAEGSEGHRRHSELLETWEKTTEARKYLVQDNLIHPRCEFASEQSGSSEQSHEVSVNHLLENDVGKALMRNGDRRSAPTNSYDFQNFLTELGFELNDDMDVREFTGQRMSIVSNRRNSWNMLERQGSDIEAAQGGHGATQGAVAESVQKQYEKFLVREIFGPPSQQFRIQPQHLALPHITKHVFAMQDDISFSCCSEVSESTLISDIPRRVWPHFRRYLAEPAGRLAKKKYVSCCFMILTLYALVGMDLFYALGNSDWERAFLIVNTVVFFLFASELTLYSIGLQGYLFSMPFLLDSVAVVSILSDTWFLQGGLFGDSTAQMMRMARSSRVARLARLARIARFTRMIPQLTCCCKGQKFEVGKETFKRRLWRIFLLLDTERTGSISLFDFKCLYLVMIQNHPALLNHPMRASILEEDNQWFSTSCDDLVDLDWNGFVQGFLATNVGKHLLKEHAEEIDIDEGVWRFTRNIGDRSALKISCVILLLLGALSFFDQEANVKAPALGIAELDYMARREHAQGSLMDITYICHHINMFRQRYEPAFIYLDGYIRWQDGRCLHGNATATRSGAFQIIDRLIEDSKLRPTDYKIACAPDFEDCAKEHISSVVLIDYSSAARLSAWKVLLSTVLVIFLLLIFIAIMNAKMGTFAKTLLTPIRTLLDDMNILSILELANVDEDMPSPSFVKRIHRVPLELADLQQNFKSLRNAIRSWSKYVPPSVVQRLFVAGLEAEIGVSKVTCTILFCDLVGFEDACEGLEPQEVLLVLATALGTVSEVIGRYRGTLLEFIGDEVLAVYNAPNKVKHHVYAGVMSALDIHFATSQLPQFVSKSGSAISLRFRCGVHSGQILAGNIGSHQRMKYGLLGDSINLTARLKTLNSRYATQTLVSNVVLEDEFCMRRIKVRPVDVVTVKGKKKPTVVYEPVDPESPEVAEAMEAHKEAFTLYQGRSFQEAEAKFEDVMKVFGESDGPSALLKSRCARYVADPPDSDWDGVERLNAKSFQPG
mmetsp:Transcript_7696/g.24503  ORF Transcript_7696/g.24503 Transcript_7696/m.24503 type:complete len:1051 (-) Transcript_7696:106-3258(-)